MARIFGQSLFLILVFVISISASSRRSVIFDSSRAGILELRLFAADQKSAEKASVDEKELVYSVSLSGTHVRKTQNISPGKNIVFESLPEDTYSVKLHRAQEKIYQFSCFVRRRKTIMAELYVQGSEHRPGQKEPFYCYHILSGGDLQGRRKIFYEGWSQTFVANGDIEYEKDGFTLIRDRFGHYHYSEEKIGTEDDYELIMGLKQLPFITELRFTNLTEVKRGLNADYGDLLQVEVFVESSDGPSVSEVNLQIFRMGKMVLHRAFSDDGSVADSDMKKPGKQISGDLKIDDGIFSCILPVDREMRDLLKNSMWIFSLQNTAGRTGNEYIKYMYSEAEEFFLPVNGSVFDFSDLQYRSLPTLAHLHGTGSGESELSFSLPEKMSVYILSGKDKINLYPTAEENGRFFYNQALRIKQNDFFLLVIVDNSGQMYYTGEVF